MIYNDERNNNLMIDIRGKKSLKNSPNRSTSRIIMDNAIEYTIDECKRFVKLLSPERFNDKISLMNVGLCLYSIAEDMNDEEGVLYRAWYRMIKKHSDIEEYSDRKVVKKIWSRFERVNYTTTTLVMWANKDNSQEVKKIHVDCLWNMVTDIIDEAGTTVGEEDIANLLVPLVAGRWVYSSKEKRFYYFDNQKWNKDHTDMYLDSEISNLYDILSLMLCERITEQVNDGYSVDDATKKNMPLRKLTRMLRQKKLIDLVIKCMKTKIEEPDFSDKIDKSIYLLGFTDGVYDLKKMEFRETVPSDYVEKTTGYAYGDLDKITNDDVKEFMDIFSKIFPSEQQRSYMLDLYSSCLNGFQQQFFHILAGRNNSGGNGKGLIKRIMCKAMGKYAVEYNISILTQNAQKSNQASPDREVLRNVRYACASEPEKNSVLNSNLIKLFTGGDTISSRELYGCQSDFKPQYTLFMECNNKPSCDSEDSGVLRRFRVVEFKSVFVQDEKKVDPSKNIYPMDTSLYYDEKLERYGKVMMKLMLENYKVMVKNGTENNIPMTNEIKETTQRYFQDTNSFISFLDDNYTYTGNLEQHEHNNSLQTLFTEFTRTECYKSLPKRAKLKKGECHEFIISSKYEEHYYYEGKITAEGQTKKHPVKKNYNILAGYCNNKILEEYDNMFN